MNATLSCAQEKGHRVFVFRSNSCYSMALKCPELTFIKVLVPPLLRINSALSIQVLIKNFLEIITMIMYHYNANQIR